MGHNKKKKTQLNEYTKLSRMSNHKSNKKERSVTVSDNWYDVNHCMFAIVDILCLIFTIFGILENIGIRYEFKLFQPNQGVGVFEIIAIVFWFFLLLGLQVSSWNDPFMEENKGCNMLKGSCRLMFFVSACLMAELSQGVLYTICIIILAIIAIVINIRCLLYLRKYSEFEESKEIVDTSAYCIIFFILFAAILAQLCAIGVIIKRTIDARAISNYLPVQNGIVNSKLPPIAGVSAIVAFIVLFTLIIYYRYASKRMQCAIVSGIYGCIFNVLYALFAASNVSILGLLLPILLIYSFMSYGGAFFVSAREYIAVRMKTDNQVYNNKKDNKDKEKDRAGKSREFEYSMIFELDAKGLQEVYDAIIETDGMSFYKNMDITIEKVDDYTSRIKCSMVRPFVFNFISALSKSYDKKMEQRINSELIAKLRSRIYVGK